MKDSIFIVKFLLQNLFFTIHVFLKSILQILIVGRLKVSFMGNRIETMNLRI